MIIRDFFVNLTILVSLLFLYSQISSKFPLTSKSPMKVKIFTGVLGGLLSIILMQFSIEIDATIVDLRHIPTILLAYYGGAIPAFIAMILTIMGRFFVSANIASYFAVITSVSGTIFAILFSKINCSRNVKIISIITFNNLVFTFVFSYLIYDLITILKVMPIYWFASYVSAFLSFYILRYIRKSQRLFNKYQTESITDSLTGLNNVRKFDEVFNHLISELKINEQKLSLLYIDIDFFKRVNDIYGHSEGDVVLKELGLRLKNNTRAFDIVSRNGGEEFTAILLDCPLSRAVEIAERIRGNVENKPFILNSGKKLNLTVSIGVASYQETTNDPLILIEDADKALYDAKQSGRNKVCITPTNVSFNEKQIISNKLH
ncbi:diguanylate cyclase [Bacillus sp. FJAT-50079]|uniref:GGDEF domain-containing protein n=1 Tax=Bacillus sp. FJAT-50079 TaxID=2833577 RepID=UPI001BC8DAB8|nr:diguanylate cyclase [Bacillus sp. FJAT-50079]MBS4207242.1 diguanylate cyclase [Bacillus sp. FJAT-50079]